MEDDALIRHDSAANFDFHTGRPERHLGVGERARGRLRIWDCGVRGLVHALRGRLRRAADLFVRRRGVVFCPGDAAGGADGALGVESKLVTYSSSAHPASPQLAIVLDAAARSKGWTPARYVSRYRS